MQRVAVCAMLILAGLALATGLLTTDISTPPALPAARSGQIFEHIDAIYDQQGNLIGGDIDGVSMDSLYWRPGDVSYLYVSPKVQSPSPVQRTPMSFHNPWSTPSMDPSGDYVYEVDGANLYRYSTVNGSMTTYSLSPSGTGKACATDGQYIYAASSEYSRSIYKYTMTGTYVNTTTLNQVVEGITSSVCRDTFWGTPSVGNSVLYAYPTSQFNGDSINYVTTWNIGSGSPPYVVGNVAYDGTYFYIGWLAGSNNRFKRFYSDRTLWTTGTVSLSDFRSLMAVSLPAMPGDVGAARIIAPSGDIPYGVPVVPQAKVSNYSTVVQTFTVRFDIDTIYNCTRYVHNLLPNDSVTVSFDTFPATAPGSHAVKCSTQLSTDTVPSNDKATDACFVSLVDAGTRAILVPTGTIPYGTPVTPQARVKNFGTAAATFTARFTIGTFYRDSQTISSLAAGDSVTVNFAQWAADTAGAFATRCSTRLSGDQIPADDTASDSVFVQLTGVADSPFLVPLSSFLVSPNPLASGFATVSFTGALEHSGTAALRLSIYDISGRLVRQSAIHNLLSAVTLDFRSVPAGVYVVKLDSGTSSLTRMLVIE